jgi:hypothetical protein
LAIPAAAPSKTANRSAPVGVTAEITFIENLAPVTLTTGAGRPGTQVVPRAVIGADSGVHPARAGGPWLCRILVPSGLRAVVVPSGCRATVQPHW